MPGPQDGAASPAPESRSWPARAPRRRSSGRARRRAGREGRRAARITRSSGAARRRDPADRSGAARRGGFPRGRRRQEDAPLARLRTGTAVATPHGTKPAPRNFGPRSSTPHALVDRHAAGSTTARRASPRSSPPGMTLVEARSGHDHAAGSQGYGATGVANPHGLSDDPMRRHGARSRQGGDLTDSGRCNLVATASGTIAAPGPRPRFSPRRRASQGGDAGQFDWTASLEAGGGHRDRETCLAILCSPVSPGTCRTQEALGVQLNRRQQPAARRALRASGAALFRCRSGSFAAFLRLE